jgi:hypothetical protein
VPSMRFARFSVPLAVTVAMVTTAFPEMTTARPRPMFEPTDLELEEAGVVEMDLQVGALRGQGAWRAVLPDFELDVGLLSNLELDLDGAYAIEGPPTGGFSFDHSVPDSLWPSLKIGVYDDRDQIGDRAWALGIQAGPKLPVASGNHGLGLESLLLVGRTLGRLHAVLNFGGFVDPAPTATAPRPIGLESGIDLSVELDAAKRFSVTGELGGVRFLSSDPGQLLATGGLSWSVSPHLDLSVSALYGFLLGSDRYGLLLGVSPKVGPLPR